MLETIANFIATSLWLPWALMGASVFILFLANKESKQA